MPRIKHKRWIPICGLGVAMMVAIATAAMTGSCVFDTRTNFCDKYGIRCKEGQECAAQQAACIDIGSCGDGITERDKGEVCDDGNIVDGEMVDGKLVLDDCRHDCMSNQRCGNNIMDAGETCDHGIHNGQPDDSCDELCQLRDEFCGNGAVDTDMGEQCDPGEMDSAGCNSKQANEPANLLDPNRTAGCKFPTCGDGYVNKAAGEQCDSGDAPTMECNGPPLCTTSACGDNFRNATAGEDCDNGGDDTAGCNGNNHSKGGAASCKFPRCGDGYLNMASTPKGSKQVEACDTGGDSQMCNGDGNGDAKNDSNAECQQPSCGDGYANKEFKPGNGATATEECDNKGGDDTPGCNGNHGGMDGPGSCRKPICGDGYLNMKFQPPGSSLPEKCDTGGDSQTCNGGGNNNPVNNSDAKCQSPSCGDGYINKEFKPGNGATATEECDNKGGGDTLGCNGNNGGDDGPGSCRMPKCGDGYVNKKFTPSGAPGPEQCDNGAGNSDTKADACRTNCQEHFCGDGVIDTGEDCDPRKVPSGCGTQETCNSTGPKACKCT